MKRYLMLMSILVLVAGCASEQGGYPPSNNEMTTDAGYGSIPAPTQQGSGAYAMTSQPQSNVRAYSNVGASNVGAYPAAPAPIITSTPAPISAAVGGYAAPVYEQSTGGSYSTPVRLTDADIKFIQTAAQDGLTKIRMGQLAVQDGQSIELRNYGQRLITDHTQANQRLTQIASQKGVVVPAQPDPQQEQMVIELSNLSSTDFDRSLEQHAIQGHEWDIRIYQDASNNLQDPELRTFAQQTLPMLQHHLAEARQLARGTATLSPTGVSQ